MFHLDRIVENSGVYVIAEMSANHAGKLENAIKIINEAKEAGADCLKIQTYTADTITIDCNNEYFRIHGGLWDGYKLHDLYKDAYTPWEWQAEIKSECDRVGLDFLSTPFDFSSVDFLESIGCEAYKIASFELVDIPLIEYAASKGKPMIISCGMASADEIEDALEACRRVGNEQVVLLKCCSEYPANWADMHLANIPDMAQRFGVRIGLSDHSAGSLAAVVGVSLGACVIEKHLCLSRDIPNPDSAFSMEPAEFSQMVKDARDAAIIRGQVYYGPSEKEKANLMFRRSLFAVKDIVAGEKFTAENVRSIRPANGLMPKYYSEILGTTASEDISFGTPLTKSLLEKYSQFETERTICCLMTSDDAPLIVRWRSDPDIIRNFANSKPLSLEDHLQWFEKTSRNLERFDFVVTYKNNNAPIGTVTLSKQPDNKWEIGYMIAEKDYQRLGLGKEIAVGICDFAKNTLNVETVIAKIRFDNIPSIKLIEAIGFSRVDENDGFLTFEKVMLDE